MTQRHTLSSYIAAVQAGTIDPAMYLAESLAHAQTLNEQYNAFVNFHPEISETVDSEAVRQLPLAGAPIAIKDNIIWMNALLN